MSACQKAWNQLESVFLAIVMRVDVLRLLLESDRQPKSQQFGFGFPDSSGRKSSETPPDTLITWFLVVRWQPGWKNSVGGKN